jgi:hypothetical protein
VTLGAEASDKDTLPNLLEKTTSARLHLLKLDAPKRELAIKQLTDVRNTSQHGNYEQAAAQANVASVAEYFGKVFAGEVEALYQVLADLIEQVDSSEAKAIRTFPPRRLQ